MGFPPPLPSPCLGKSHWLTSLRDQGPPVRTDIPRCGLRSVEPLWACHPLPRNTPSLSLLLGLSVPCPPPPANTCSMVPIPPPFWAADVSVPNLYGLPLGSWRAGVSSRDRMQATKTSNVLSWLLGNQLLKILFVSSINRIQSLARASSEESIGGEDRRQKPAG